MPAYFVEQRHVSLTKMGLFSFFSFAGIAIVALLAGLAADLIIKRGGDAVFVRKAFVIGGFAIACTELIGVQSSSVQGALFWAIVSLSGLGLTTANSLALCRMTLIPRQAVGLVTGIQNVSTSLAGIVGPILSGWLLQVSGGYRAPMMVIFRLPAAGCPLHRGAAAARVVAESHSGDVADAEFRPWRPRPSRRPNARYAGL